jgi:hypothetical protein
LVEKREHSFLLQLPYLRVLLNPVFKGQAEVEESSGIVKGYWFISADRNGFELFYAEEIAQSEMVTCPRKTMDYIGKRKLPFACRTNAEHLNTSIPLFFLNGNSGLGCLFSPKVARLFELYLSVVDPKIDRPICLSLKDALIKTGSFQ